MRPSYTGNLNLLSVVRSYYDRRPCRIVEYSEYFKDVVLLSVCFGRQLDSFDEEHWLFGVIYSHYQYGGG